MGLTTMGNDFVEYFPETGVFIRKPRSDRRRSWNTRYAGKPAFTSKGTNGYLSGEIDGRGVYAHRVAWEIANGPIPKGMDIDHINGDKADNRLENLRLASRSQNARNRKANRSSTSKYLGVSWSDRYRKWVAQITCGGKNIYLGRYLHEIDAANAYDAAAMKIDGEFSRLNMAQQSAADTTLRARNSERAAQMGARE